MDFAKHPNHTSYMGAPSDWNEQRDGPCGALSIHDMRDQPMPKMESCWVPTEGEALCLALGIADIRLGILGRVHPPVYMSVYPKAFVNDDALHEHMRTKFAEALKQLRDIAQQNGYTVILEASGNVIVEKA